jgi:glucose-1-phosphate thymidylyltransferase
MKAVLLARGLGSRMRQRGDATGLTEDQAAAAAAGAKGMMPIPATFGASPQTSLPANTTFGASPQTSLPANRQGRPFLDYVLSALADAGGTSVCFVVAPGHSGLRDYYDGRGRPARLDVAYAVQPVANGTARAVQCARAFAGTDPFLVLNSDNLYSAPVLRGLIELKGPGLPAYERDSLVLDSGFPADRVGCFAAIEVGADGCLTRVLEKPGREYYDAAGPHALISMNVWRFDARIFEACRDVARSPRGEYELPEAVALAVSRGVKFQTFRASGAVLDLSRRSDVAVVSRRLDGVEPNP